MVSKVNCHSVKLIKIPSHFGIFGNEIADQNAKNIAHKIFKCDITAPQTVNIHDPYRISADIAKKSWQRQWDNESTGSSLITLYRSLAPKSYFLKIGIYFRMLVHETMLKDDSYRTGTSVIPLCDCGKEKETVEHLILRCSDHEAARHTLIDSLEDTGIMSKYRGITDGLLLAPPCDNDISKKDNYIIKEALFEFLSSLNRKI